MKKLNVLLIIGIIVPTVLFTSCKKDEETDNPPDQTTGEFIDNRDNQVYKWVKIGNQTWFAENLNIGTQIQNIIEMNNNNIIEKYCYNNDGSNCEIYGGLYQWDEMMQYDTTSSNKGICPNGWRLPTNEDWNTLINNLGGAEVAGGKMKKVGTEYWDNSNIATNSSGFSALPSGARSGNDNLFFGISMGAYIYSSSEYDNEKANYLLLRSEGSETNINKNKKTYGRAVRCIKE